MGGADFGQDGGIRGGHGAFLRGDPGAHAIGGGVHGGEGRTAKGVMNECGGEGVAGAYGVGDFYGEAGMFVMGVGGDQDAAMCTASDADQAHGEFAAEPAGGGNIRARGIFQRALQKIEEGGKFFVI